MNVIVPVAGLGSRMRPLTLTRPKPLLHVAGAHLLDHALAPVRAALGAEVDSWVFVVDRFGGDVETFVRDELKLDAVFVRQSEPRGQAHAIAQAGDWLDGPVLIVFPDMVYDADLERLRSLSETDGTLFAAEVDDPQRFGVVTTDSRGHAKRLIEKPVEPVSRRAVVGLYHVADGARLGEALDRTIASGQQSKGEFYLASALQMMIDEGARFQVLPVRRWLDCGTLEDLQSANTVLLSEIAHSVPAGSVIDAEVRPPVHVAEGARIVGGVIGPGCFIGPGSLVEHSRLGPSVSVESTAQISRSTVSNSLLHTGVVVSDTTLSDSLVGSNVVLAGVDVRVVLGDECLVSADPAVSVSVAP